MQNFSSTKCCINQTLQNFPTSAQPLHRDLDPLVEVVGDLLPHAPVLHGPDDPLEAAVPGLVQEVPVATSGGGGDADSQSFPAGTRSYMGYTDNWVSILLISPQVYLSIILSLLVRLVSIAGLNVNNTSWLIYTYKPVLNIWPVLCENNACCYTLSLEINIIPFWELIVSSTFQYIQPPLGWCPPC